MGLVYFIQADGGGPIKIGRTASTGIDRRLAAIQAASPVRLRVIRLEQGDSRLEATYHRRFASLRMHGEWFRPGEGLIDFLNGAAATTAAGAVEMIRGRSAECPPRLPRGRMLVQCRRVHRVLAEAQHAWLTPVAIRRRGADVSALSVALRLLRAGGWAERRERGPGRTEWRVA